MKHISIQCMRIKYETYASLHMRSKTVRKYTKYRRYFVLHMRYYIWENKWSKKNIKTTRKNPEYITENDKTTGPRDEQRKIQDHKSLTIRNMRNCRLTETNISEITILWIDIHTLPRKEETGLEIEIRTHRN